MEDSDYIAQDLEEAGDIESEPLPSITTVDSLPIAQQIAFRCRLFGLFSLRLLLVVSLVLVLENTHPLGENFQREAADHAFVTILLPMIALMLVLQTLSSNHLSPVLEWMCVLMLSLIEAVLLAAYDAIDDSNSGVWAAVFALCTVVAMALTSFVKRSTPAKLLGSVATAGIAGTVNTVAMVSLYACGQLGSLTLPGFLVLLLAEWLLAGWIASRAIKIYATMEPSQLAKAVASMYPSLRS